MMPPVSVCHQVSTMGQRPLPITVEYHIHVSGLMGSPTLPSSRRTGELVAIGKFVAPLDERANGRRRCVKNRHAMIVNDLPEAIVLGKIRRALIHHRGDAVLQESHTPRRSGP